MISASQTSTDSSRWQTRSRLEAGRKDTALSKFFLPVATPPPRCTPTPPCYHGLAVPLPFFPGRTTMRTPPLLRSLALLLLLSAAAQAEPNVQDTRLLTQPAVSARQVAFVYADDLWVADLDGGPARRLTSDLGVESHPVFSPDGNTIAFSAQYEGN